MGHRKTAFEVAFQEFCDELTKDPKQKKKLAFIDRIKVANGTSTPEDVQNAVEDIVSASRDKQLRRLYSHLRPVVDAMRDYTGVLDTMVQAYPFPTALIWGGLRIFLETAGRYSKQFDGIKDKVQLLPDILWELSSFENLYGTSLYASDVVRRILSKSYITILHFWYRSTKTLEHPVASALKENKKLQSLLNSLQENWDHLDKIRAGVEAQLSQETREQITSMQTELADEHVKTAIERSAAAIERSEAKEDRRQAELERAEAQKERELAVLEREKAEAERKLMEEERKAQQAHRDQDAYWKTIEKLKSSMTRIESSYNTFNWGVYEAARRERHQGTCEWLYAHKKFEQWAAKKSQYPILWLNGKHGAGKSVLCASAIEHLKPIDPKAAPRIAFQFLTKDQYIPRNQLLRNIAFQLLYPFTINPEAIPTCLEPFLYINADDSSAVEALIHTLLIEIPLTYIFVDGLDEVEYADDEPSMLSTNRNLDVPAFISFLVGEVQQQPAKVRLWCSSQPLPQIRNYICKPEWRDNLQELSLTTEHTANDILHYLESAIPESTADKGLFASMFATAALTSEVEGSFLWAKLMLNDLKDRAEDADDLINLAKQGLPNKIEQLYCKIIRKIQEKDGGAKDLPLWKIVLSLVTYAKRPLRVTEVIEAVAIIRTSQGYDLNDSKRVSPTKILDSCMSLIRYINDQGDISSVVLRLSHSAVRTFLLKNSAKDCCAGSDDKLLVCSRIIREACMRYLCQPRYSGLLVRDTSTAWGFRTLTGEYVESHRLLSYAAKYWYQHFDSPAQSVDGEASVPALPSTEEKQAVVKFLGSSHFSTCMQVQSLFVMGHFLQRFDPITDQAQTLRRTLPNWIARVNPQLHRDYSNFQCEWCHLLQSGQSLEFGGQVDRCFWKALGSANFLSGNASRYQSFDFAPIAKASETGANKCMIQKMSSDGKTLIACWIQREGDTTTAQFEEWDIDGTNIPKVTKQISVPFSVDDTNIKRYWLPCSTNIRSLPVVPSEDCSMPPIAISFCLDYSVVRVGSKIFQSKLSEQQRLGFTQLADNVLGESWEDVCTTESHIIVCRRRIPRRQPPTAAEIEERRIQLIKDRISDFKEKRYERSRSRSRRDGRRRLRPRRVSPSEFEKMLNQGISLEEILFSESSSDFSDSDSDSDSSDSDTDRSSKKDLDLHSASESWSEGSTATESSSDSSIASDKENESDDEENAKDESGFDSDKSDDEKSEAASSDIRSNIDNNDSSDTESVLSCVSISQFVDDSDEEPEGYNSDDDMSDDEAFKAMIPPTNTEPDYPVTISDRKMRIVCDGCNKGPFQEYFHCTICCGSNFDLCIQCEKRGRWCLDQGHQLHRMLNGQNVGVVSRRNFRIRQELAVYNKEGDQKEPVFHIRRKYASFLYQSPPIVHPKHNLVIWPLTGSSLLFADFKSNKFFEQKIKTSKSKNSRPICVNLSLSPCGNHVRVATIDARAEKIKCYPKSKSRLCLNLHVMVLQLSASKPTRVPPKLVSTMSIRLGQCIRPLVQQLPFAFTWSAEDLYLTISEPRLHVYRVVMPKLQDTPADSDSSADKPQFTVMTHKETIFLPRSSRNRSVQYFPPQEAGAMSTVIIGPRYGRNPAPPIGVYLSEKDLGEWMPVQEGGMGDRLAYTPHKGLEGQMEEFDEEQDCDLIPFEC